VDHAHIRIVGGYGQAELIESRPSLLPGQFYRNYPVPRSFADPPPDMPCNCGHNVIVHRPEIFLQRRKYDQDVPHGIFFSRQKSSVTAGQQKQGY